MRRIWTITTEWSLLLVAGAVIALVWANLAPESYHALVELKLLDQSPIGKLQEDGTRYLSLHYLVNDLLMAFFFALAGKEVWEAIALPQGSLRGRRAATPLIATAGGMLGPIAVYLGLTALMGSTAWDALADGWAVPTATDIAFSYLVGRIVFGAGHPAVQFLMLLAIADDAAGLVILAVFYPSAELAPAWLLMSFGAAALAYLLFNAGPRRIGGAVADLAQRLGPWPYALAAAISWFGFQEAGIHPALGLLPVIAAIPNAGQDFGPRSPLDAQQSDLLNRIEHALKPPVQVVLFLFGLLNAGVEFSAIGAPTWIVLAGLLLGKPFGILLFGWVAAVVLRLGLPEGMRVRDLFVLGSVAGIGFTVSLFVASVAFTPGEMLDGTPVLEAVKMGALFSFAGSILAITAGRLLKVQRQP